jgi:HK97 family phage prohead protease
MQTETSPEVITRGYSKIDIRAFTEDENNYYITGLATTPTPDRLGDIIDPMGAKFALPLPLLWQHDSRSPIGNVTNAKATKSGIPITAAIPKVKEAGILQDRINEAVQSIKYKLVAGLSIGFRAVNNAMEFLETGGIKFNETEVMELSVVTIPCNSDCTIQTIKSLDSKQRAASGKPAAGVVRLSPGVAGKSKAGVVRLADIPLPKAET